MRLTLLCSALIATSVPIWGQGFIIDGIVTTTSPANSPAVHQLVSIEDSTGSLFGSLHYSIYTDSNGAYLLNLNSVSSTGVLRVTTIDCQNNVFLSRHPYSFGPGSFYASDVFQIVCAVAPVVSSGPLALIQGSVLDPNGSPWNNAQVIVHDSGANGLILVYPLLPTNANGYYMDSLALADTVGVLSVSVLDCNGLFTATSSTPYSTSPSVSLTFIDTLVTPCIAASGNPFWGTAFVEGWLLGNATGSGAWPNELVQIDVFSGGQTYSFAAPTDFSGYYANSIPLVDSQGTIEIYVIDCAGQAIGSTYNYTAGPTGLIFTDTLTVSCMPGGGPLNCTAEFVVDTVNSFNGQVVLWNTSSGFSAIGNAQFAWDFGDGNTSTLPFPNHQYAQAGMYEVCLVLLVTDPQTGSVCYSSYCDSLGMDSLGNLIYKGQLTGFELVVLNPATIGVGENVLEQVRPFPNPASDFVQISGLTSSVDYRLIDGFGRTVSEGRLNQEDKIAVDQLASGIYVLQLNDGKVQASHRLLLN